MKGIPINAKPISEEKISGCATAFLTTFGAIFLLVGLIAFWFILVKPLMDWQSAKSWPVASGVIIDSRIKSHHGDGSTTYSAEFDYEYEVAGKPYQNNRYGITNVSGSHSGAAALIREHPIGSKIPIFYNPSDPVDSLMNRDIGWGMLFGLIPIIFVCVGGLIIWAAQVNGWANLKSKFRSKSKEISPVLSGSNNFSSSLSGTSNQQSPDDLLDFEFDGPLKLKPDISRLFLFLGLCVACVFWNGIVSIFVTDIITDGFPLFPTIFMVPFVIIGIGLVGGCFYALLAMFNPKIEIALSNGAVPIGSDVDIAWEVVGNAGRFRKLTITIEGEEHATYRQGTDTRTETKSFSKIVVTDTTSQDEIPFGTAVVNIPGDTIHSFKASNNEIKWLVKVRGDIPMWPDVNEVLSFRVKPPAQDLPNG